MNSSTPQQNRLGLAGLTVAIVALGVSAYGQFKQPTTLPSNIATTSLESADALQRVRKAKTFKAAYIVYPPTVSAASSPAEPTGFLVDILNEIAKRSKLSVTYEPTTFEDFKAALDNRRADVICAGLFIDPSRAKELSFTEPIMYWSGVAAISRKEAASRFPTIVSIDNPNLRIAVTNGTAEHDFLKHTLQNAKPNPIPNSDISLTLSEVASKRADVAFADIVTIRKFVKDKPELVVLFGGKPLNTYATALGVRTGDADWLAFLNSSIIALHADGTIGALSRKYHGEELWMLPNRPWAE